MRPRRQGGTGLGALEMINEERGNTENGAGRKEECRYWAENLNAMIKQLLIQEILGYVGTKGPEAGEKT